MDFQTDSINRPSVIVMLFSILLLARGAALVMVVGVSRNGLVNVFLKGFG